MMFPAATKVVFGKRILEMNPSLASDIRGFLEELPTLLAGWPRWLAPTAHRKRDAALVPIKKWHNEIEGHHVGNNDWNPYHGSDYVKARREFLSKFEEVDIDEQASETLGLFMG
jgi:hypothetical protein